MGKDWRRGQRREIIRVGTKVEKFKSMRKVKEKYPNAKFQNISECCRGIRLHGDDKSEYFYADEIVEIYFG